MRKTRNALAEVNVAAGKLCIRTARSAEAELLTDLSLRSKAFWGYDASFLARCRTVMTVTARDIETHPHCVAELDGRIAGFYGFEPEAAGVGLDHFFVEADLVRRGIGGALWRHAVDTARSLGHSALIVVSDPNAAGFYLKMGCRRIGTRPSELEIGRQLPLLRFML